MSKFFQRAANSQQGNTQNNANPQQFFEGIAQQAQEIQNTNSGAAQQAQQYAQNLLNSGRITQAQYNRAWDMARQIAARFRR